MKRSLSIISIAVIYIAVIYFYSMFFGLPPFNRGIIIGYPAIYYEFNVSGDPSAQHGFMKISNLAFNIIIILFIYGICNYILKGYRKYKK